MSTQNQGEDLALTHERLLEDFRRLAGRYSLEQSRNRTLSAALAAVEVLCARADEDAVGCVDVDDLRVALRGVT